MRKTTRIVCAACAALASPLAAIAATETVDGIEWTYTVTNGLASVGGGTWDSTAIPQNTKGSIVIPTTLGGYTVAYVARYAFFACSWMTSVSLPDGIVGIGPSAFRECSGLEDVTIPQGVTTIEGDCFYNCYALRSVEIPEGVTNVSSWAFQNCSSLTSVTIPASVRRIQSSAFYNCTSLSNVTFEGDRDSIDMDVGSTFQCTPYLESLDFCLVIVNNRVTGFLGTCPATVDVPEGVRELSYQAFSAYRGPSATNLVSITLPESLYYISSAAFSGCCRLTTINIPADVSYFGNDTFNECRALSNVTFGREDYLTFYDMRAFAGTPFSDTLPFQMHYGWRMHDGWDGEELYVTGYIGKCPGDLDIDALDAVRVAQWDGQRQRRLEETGDDIGEAPAIRGIAEYAFAGCNIKSVVLPASLSAIEQGAFFCCTNMTRIVFTGNAPEDIAEDAFYNEEGHYDEWDRWWTDYYGANTNCMVYVPANSTGWGVDIPGEWRGMRIAYSTVFNVEDGVLVSVVAGEDTELTIPAGVTNIAANAFAGCGGLERITIPDAVTAIDPTAFAGCEKLWAKWFRTLERLSGEDADSASEVALTVTNVVVHYVTQSVPSAAVVPSETTGIVSVIGEVNAGSALAIPSTWADQYGAAFTAKFGNDFAKAVTAQTGKRDGAGNLMQVWQDFVAGTDPTNPDDVFRASITFDEATGDPIISWTPELSAVEAAKRNYKTFGKVRLTDAEWTLVNGDAAAYNFFKVTVEMR